jgi:DNA-binding XRE family transcriptional regulator
MGADAGQWTEEWGYTDYRVLPNGRNTTSERGARSMSQWLGWKALGRQVRALRRMRGVSQAELATAVGLNRTSITNIEAGRQQITVEKYYQIAAALGYEVRVRLVNTLPLERGIWQ